VLGQAGGQRALAPREQLPRSDHAGSLETIALQSGAADAQPCDVVADTNVLAAGIGSEIVTPVAVSGALFATTFVHVTLLPTLTGFGEPILVDARSTSGEITSCSSAHVLVVAALFESRNDSPASIGCRTR
jgi:hypothetical protein